MLYIIFILLVFVDQVFKFFIYNTSLRFGESFSIIDGILSLTYVENRGAAFGIFQGNTLILSIISILIICLLIYLMKSYTLADKNIKILFIVIIAGGIGNLIDRIFRGFVIDYIELDFIKFPVFNLADIFVSVGCSLLMIYVLFKSK